MIPLTEIVLLLTGLFVGFIFSFLQERMREKREDKIKKERLKKILKTELILMKSELEDGKEKWKLRLERLSDTRFDPRLWVNYPITYHLEKLGLELFILNDPIPEHVFLLKRKLSSLRNRIDVAIQMSNIKARDFDSFPHEKKELVKGLFGENAIDVLEKFNDVLEYTKELEELLI